MRACTGSEATTVKPHRSALTCTLCGRTYDVDDPLTREARQVLVAHQVVRHDTPGRRWSLGALLDCYTKARVEPAP